MSHRLPILILIAAAIPLVDAVDRVGPPEAYTAAVGITNPDVGQSNIRTTICKPGWTKTIRPPASYTNKLKVEQMAKLGLKGKPSDYEEDHLISLEIAGDPTDPRNLAPEAYAGKYGARVKDQVEDHLHRMVCARLDPMPLSVAQNCIKADWILCGQKIGAIK